MAAVAMYRLFVAGYPESVTGAQLSGKFRSFGTVHGVEPIAGKPFAYVDVECAPSDLARLLKAFKNTKWGEAYFRVEVAKPDYLQRLQDSRLRAADEQVCM
jgi:hypothetical protein